MFSTGYQPFDVLFGLTGDRFSELTDFAFEFVDFIAKLFEQFMHLRIGMGWPMFGMLVSFEAFAEVLFVFFGFLMDSMSQIVHTRLFEVLGCHVHVLNPVTMFVHLPFNVSMFCFSMGPVPLVLRSRQFSMSRFSALTTLMPCLWLPSRTQSLMMTSLL